MSVAIYMFHAIGEVTRDDWADINYSFCKSKFIAFLEAAGKVSSFEQLQKEGVRDAVVLTFDDGHISNYWAAKYLCSKNYGTADFFINPALVGNENYMSWDQIKELSLLGMSIQSHGLDHKYFTDCTNEELKNQLVKSKNEIETRINKKVTILAPPGGRYDERTIKIAKDSGYRFVTNSMPGIVSNVDDFLQPRIAVMKDSAVNDLLSVMNKYSLLIFKQKLKYRILSSVKILLGNKVYEQIRWKLLGGEK